MRDRPSSTLNRWRGLALVCTVALGLVTIVGSGGGGGFLCPGPCAGDFPPEPRTPVVSPPNINLQVGGTAVFSVSAPEISNPAIQWSRAAKGGPFVAIPGATLATYTLAGAQLVDDGATYAASVQGAFNGTQVALFSAPGHLAVSSMPGVVFQDSEFLPADWSVAAISAPSSNGPTHGEAQVPTGGNPGAYRQMTIVMPAGPNQLYVFHAFRPVTYDPASQGPVYFVEFNQDCLLLPGTLDVGPTLLIEQDGRRFIAGGPTQCGASAWRNTLLIPGTSGVTDFLQVDGPACAAGERCPNFSATGKPIRFGFANSNEGLVGFAGASGGFGIDNWKVTVWRR
jgi:hypothetical protein